MCRELKPFSAFHRHAKGKFGLMAPCIECAKAVRRATRSAREPGDYNREKKMAAGRMVFDYLRQNSCVDCGESDPRVLDFDHVPELGEKYMEISAMINKFKPLYMIRVEMTKCEVRCKNCHAVRTHQVNNSWRHQLWMEMMTEAYQRARPQRTFVESYWEEMMQ